MHEHGRKCEFLGEIQLGLAGFELAGDAEPLARLVEVVDDLVTQLDLILNDRFFGCPVFGPFDKFALEVAFGRNFDAGGVPHEGVLLEIDLKGWPS